MQSLAISLHETFKSNVCLRLNQLGISRAELARRLGATRSFITQILGDDASVPSLQFVERMAKALGCTPAFLLTPVEREEEISASA